MVGVRGRNDAVRVLQSEGDRVVREICIGRVARLRVGFVKMYCRGRCDFLSLVVCACLVQPFVSTPLLAQSVQLDVDSPRRVVAVVPFTNLSRDQEISWVGVGFVEALVAGLSVREDIRILDPESVLRELERAGIESATDGRLLELCRDLGADLLVTGGYQRIGNRLRLTPRVVVVESGLVRSAIVVDGELDNLFELQDRVSAGLDLLGESAADLRPVQSRATEGERQAGQLLPLPNSADERLEQVAGTLRDTETVELVTGAPPPPVAPDVIVRSDSGRATLRAVRLNGTFDLDGDLDERFYDDVPSITDFVQVEPNAGVLATEQTEAWIFFDESNVYVSARAWDSTPEANWIMNEMRRDSFNLLQNEGIGFSFDTFYDRRSSIVFNVTPLAGRMDGQVNSEGSYSPDWNPIWQLQTSRFEGGWSFEASIPFKSLRYRPGRIQIWGFQMRRDVMWKNEMSHIVPIDAGLGRGGLLEASLHPSLVGLEAPEFGNLLEIKPFVIGDLSSDFTALPVLSNQVGGNVGIDVLKYGVTENLTADFTLNTDFAQVEADEQQVNLTRFSLFFPEKREFFLENQGVFAFGTGGRRSRSGGSRDAPILFYSRRIGLNRGLEVPIRVGGRLTGRAGPYTIGLLSIQTGEDSAAEAQSTNYSVVRIRRDILRRSSIGTILTNRSMSVVSPVQGDNLVIGFDAALAFYDNLSMNAYWAKTDTAGLDGADTSYTGDLRYAGDRYGVTVEHLFIDKRFSPELGFVRRDDMRKSYGSVRFSPRPRGLASVRKFTWEGSYNYITDADGFVETREPHGRFGIEFENSDQFDLTFTRTYDFLKTPFGIAEDILIPSGPYDFQNTRVDYGFGSQRRLSGNIGFERGTFYGGTKTTVSIGGSGRGPFGGGRIEISPKLSLEPGMSLNWVDVPQGQFTTTLVTTRATYTMTPLTFVSALAQYNSDQSALSLNIRLRWEYGPGSELFVVYNEQRDTLVPNRFTGLDNRAFIIKLNRLFRF